MERFLPHPYSFLKHMYSFLSVFWVKVSHSLCSPRWSWLRSLLALGLQADTTLPAMVRILILPLKLPVFNLVLDFFFSFCNLHTLGGSHFDFLFFLFLQQQSLPFYYWEPTPKSSVDRWLESWAAPTLSMLSHSNIYDKLWPLNTKHFVPPLQLELSCPNSLCLFHGQPLPRNITKAQWQDSG